MAPEADPNITTSDLAGSTDYAWLGPRVDVVVHGVEGDGLYKFRLGKYIAEYAVSPSILLPLASSLLLLVNLAVTCAIKLPEGGLEASLPRDNLD